MAEELGTDIWVEQTTQLDVARRIRWCQVSELWTPQSFDIVTIYNVNLFILTTVGFTAKGMGDHFRVIRVPKICYQASQSALQLLTRTHETSLPNRALRWTPRYLLHYNLFVN
jgi:hypothetical protein